MKYRILLNVIVFFLRLMNQFITILNSKCGNTVFEIEMNKFFNEV